MLFTNLPEKPVTFVPKRTAILYLPGSHTKRLKKKKEKVRINILGLHVAKLVSALSTLLIILTTARQSRKRKRAKRSMLPPPRNPFRTGCECRLHHHLPVCGPPRLSQTDRH